MSRFLSSDQSHAGDIAPPYSGGRGFQLQNGAPLLSRGFAADGVVHIVDAAGSEIIRRLPGNICRSPQAINSTRFCAGA